MSTTESSRRAPTHMVTHNNDPIMPSNLYGSISNHAEVLQKNKRIDLPGVVDGQPFSIEVESAHEVFESRIATHTKFMQSLATAKFVASLKLRTFPLPPTKNQHPYHTVFGLLYLKNFVSIPIKAPLAGVPYMVINVGVLDEGYCWQDIDLFFGSNFRKKVKEKAITSTNFDEEVQLDRHGEIPALPLANSIAMPGQQLTFLPPTVAIVENTTSAHSPPAFGGLGREIHPLNSNMDPYSDPDPALLTPNPPDSHSRTTSRLEGTPFFTVVDHQLSTPPSTLGLDDTSRRSYDVTLGHQKLHPVTNPELDSSTLRSSSKKDLASLPLPRTNG